MVELPRDAVWRRGNGTPDTHHRGESGFMSVPVLVVGGAGYIGSHTCKTLARAGFLPITYDNLSRGHPSFVKWGPLVKGDMRDQTRLLQAMHEHRIEVVLHFAGLTDVGESFIDPARYYTNNVGGTLDLLEAMRLYGCDKLIFSSTCAVYGQPDKLPISEEVAPHPANPYGASKLIIEMFLADYHRAHRLRSIVLRYFNACGADEEGELGEFREVEHSLIPRAMMALQGHVDDFQIFGTDYPTEDGTAVRDYVHVADLADAHLTALDKLIGGHPGGTYNLGTGSGYSVKAVLEKIECITKHRLRPVQGERRPGDAAVLIADPTRAYNELRFRPRRSTLDFIVGTAWAWRQKAHAQLKSGPTNSDFEFDGVVRNWCG
jgi:UDP-arabinose 4-epimerase